MDRCVACGDLRGLSPHASTTETTAGSGRATKSTCHHGASRSCSTRSRGSTGA
jgi:hypothetical protein